MDKYQSAHLPSVLDNVAAAGVYRMPRIDRKRLVTAAESIGFAVFRIDLNKAANKSELLATIAKQMAFPDWFGGNLDALADCLGDLSWHPAEGYLILLEHCDHAHNTTETGLADVLDIFQEAANEWRAQNIALWCLIDTPADGIAHLPDNQ